MRFQYQTRTRETRASRPSRISHPRLLPRLLSTATRRNRITFFSFVFFSLQGVHGCTVLHVRAGHFINFVRTVHPDINRTRRAQCVCVCVCVCVCACRARTRSFRSMPWGSGWCRRRETPSQLPGRVPPPPGDALRATASGLSEAWKRLHSRVI